MLTVIRKGKADSRLYRTQKHDTPCPITLVTHLSIDRLDRLELLCDTWNGSIAAAIFNEDRSTSNAIELNAPRFGTSMHQILHSRGAVSSTRSSIEAISRLEKEVEGSPINGKPRQTLNPRICCHLSTVLVSRRLIGGRQTGRRTPPPYTPLIESWDELYPINELRNIALDASCGEFVVLVDVDCIPSAAFVQSLSGWRVGMSGHRRRPPSSECHGDQMDRMTEYADKMAALRLMCTENLGAVVIPCFEPYVELVSDAVVPSAAKPPDVTGETLFSMCRHSKA